MSAANKADDLEHLFTNDEDSFEVQVPDFHFDWGVETESLANKQKNDSSAPISHLASLSLKHKSARSESLSPPPAPSASPSLFAGHKATPPPRRTHSARSSLSSVNIMSLTDASTASASPLAPTPPAGDSRSPRDLPFGVYSEQQNSGGSGGSSGRIYGGGRKFQRVVSAPVTRRKLEEEDEVGLAPIGEVSMLSTGVSSDTATIRPMLAHTHSGSSVSHNQTTNLPLTRGNSNNYMTPGITERTMVSTARSTTRRLAGLSRFGGPARRVMASLDAEENQEDDHKHSNGCPVLLDSPPRNTHAVHPDPMDRANPGTTSPPYPPTYPIKMGEPSTAHAESPIATESTSSAWTSIPSYPRPDERPESRQRVRTPTPQEPLSQDFGSEQPVDEDRPFRPFKSNGIENPPNNPRLDPAQYRQRHRNHNSASTVADSYRQADGATSIITQRAVSPHLVPRHSPRDENIRALRPAPLLNTHIESAVTSGVDHYPKPSASFPVNSNIPPPPPPASAPPQVAPPRTSFLVNNVAYERLQRLGKGGSSTVYSVLFSAPPKKRVIYALKLVQLERADPETYQSYTNEIELLKRLRGHDRVIQLIDHQITFGQNNRPHRLLMVMECGEIDFAALLDEQRGKAINMNFVGLYWEQMLEAVQAVHRENVVHTDLKPANFVLVKGRLKIIDFGIAKAVANDTVNIQRDQQIGTVNYMSPEAIQRMNNQKVLKLSYSSDVWSLGCILYQMIYGNPPFQHIGGGPLAKMTVIADPNHVVDYPEIAIPKTTVGVGLDGRAIDPSSLAVAVSPSAIDTMKRCLSYRKEHRLTISELLVHEFLKPKIRTPAVPPGSAFITASQIGLMVNFILRENGLPELTARDSTAEDLFSQLQAQNALTRP
ncbi:hypothetical protein IAT40_000424 [Kwoniella sp. CBS 6097]